MKKIICGVLLFVPVLGVSNPNWQRARVTVFNLTSMHTNFRCTVGKDAIFADTHSIQPKNFQIGVNDHVSIDIMQTPHQHDASCQKLLCCKQDGLSWFNYDILHLPDEIVHRHGHFHYDEAYTGAITYENELG